MCGAAHTSCTRASGEPITTVVLPARDAAVAANNGAAAAVPLASEPLALAPGQFTTATYRGRRGRRA